MRTAIHLLLVTCLDWSSVGSCERPTGAGGSVVLRWPRTNSAASSARNRRPAMQYRMKLTAWFRHASWLLKCVT